MTDPDLLKFAQLLFDMYDWQKASPHVDGIELRRIAIECGVLGKGTTNGITCYCKHPILEKQP